MWGSKGRSGYGDSTIGGDYDSWSDLSPNGKQWKNPITMETRDLSGADYWHLRKQNRPTEAVPESLHMLKNGKANIHAYADCEVKPISKVSIKDRILPQFKRLQTLRSQMVELENEYKTTDMSISTYSNLRDIIVAKIQRQEILYKRAASVKPKSYEPEPEHYEETTQHSYDNSSSVSHNDNNTERKNSWVKLRINVPSLFTNDLIYFVCGSTIILMLVLLAMKIIF